ncbi:SH3 domain-containing protein [Rhizoctonia solani]|uniref:SH3 domain-containing protein n=1 Tax=Rhizoctonia solani TaxID=456999 RepID=A0A8H8NWW7_9AGAM|nr:SH3 domain-containing protein [Rhizoctonia solani]QRW20115.1 SH3 domain-containing protein [Rhizoctonia solani]
MADEEQPPPRKVGSLRDRIAQFEKKPETTSAPPPARPAPKQWAWKAKQEAAVAAGPPTTPPRPAFSSNDAREAIAGGMGSLKERMAALQGRNIGGMAPAAKPKKIVIEREEPKEDEQAEPAQDEDEEEQARRARLAERMAKLGGARVGMGPPLFSRPQKHEETTEDDKHPRPLEPKATAVENESAPDAAEPATTDAEPATSDPHVVSDEVKPAPSDEQAVPSDDTKPAPAEEPRTCLHR